MPAGRLVLKPRPLRCEYPGAEPHTNKNGLTVYNVVDTGVWLMGPEKDAVATGRLDLRSEGAYSDARAGPSQVTGYSRKHCGQMYLP